MYLFVRAITYLHFSYTSLSFCSRRAVEGGAGGKTVSGEVLHNGVDMGNREAVGSLDLVGSPQLD